MSIVKVLKRDGRVEDWDKKKILNSIAAVGLSPDEVESIATLIEVWAQKTAENNKDNIIDSLKIREKVIDLMCAVHPQAAEEFEYFKKF